MDVQPRVAPACLAEDTLAAFADGQLEPCAYEKIEEHLADCGDCRMVLARAAVTHYPHETATSSDESPASQRVERGTRVGRYVIEELVGRGAMGTVYAARDPDLDRRVAVKLLRAEGLSDVARLRMRARLLREAQAMARLSHPEVIAVYDVGAFGDQLFVAMEYVEGETLRQWRAVRHRSFADILGVYERAGSGLAAAHEGGLVHRDFKPDNVLVGRDGRVRVTDFGLARSAGHAEDKSGATVSADLSSEPRITLTLTRTGTLLGTPAYMAPEQFRGATADARSDVFSFCVALYEASYGERPFAGATVRALQKAMETGAIRAAPVMSPVPGWLRAVLLRGLRLAPDQRYESMRALLDVLRDAHAQSRRRRVRIFAGFAGFAGALGLAASLGVVTSRRAPGPPSPELSFVSSREDHPVAPDRGTAPADTATPSSRSSESAPPASTPPNLEPAHPRTVRRVATVRPASLPPPAGATAPPAASPRVPTVGNNGAFILE